MRTEGVEAETIASAQGGTEEKAQKWGGGEGERITGGISRSENNLPVAGTENGEGQRR